MNQIPIMTPFFSRLRAPLSALALLLAATPLAGQERSAPGATEFRWAKAVPNGRLVRLSNVTGDITVVGADVERVELVATRRGTRDDAGARVEVKEHANGVTICALRNEDSSCDERGAHDDSDGGWGRDRDRASFDLEVRVPRGMRVSAGSVSGDIAVSGTTMELRAATVSGDVRLDDVRAADQVTATTVSGDVTAQFRTLARGTDLEMKSVSGDVRLTLPARAGFDLEMSTVSGDLTSDFAMEMQGRFNRRRINARINDGGSDLRVSTVSGDVRLAHNQGTNR